ncbi:MAG: hypothetical protein IT426_00610 [Pirellulales bacterium]|nr:hypothetical protein [Pirellulales bacterium]
MFYFLSGSALFARVWTDRQGRQTEAQFVRLRGDSVVLQKGLKPLVIPLKEFCDEDQEYIKELTKGKGGAKSPAVSKSGDAAENAAAPAPALKAIKPKKADEDDPFLTDAEKAAKTKATGEANPPLTDAEKSAADDSKKTAVKPQGEKVEPPKINAEGGFDARTWTDRKHNKLSANFARLEGKTVVLLKDGMERRYPLDDFSYNDKLYIRLAALELQKYQKFAGNRQSPLQQPGMPVQGMPSMSPGYGGGGAPFNSPFQGMNQSMAQQQAEAARQAQEARAAEQERARQAEAARQLQMAEQDRQRREEQQRLADIQRQNLEQQRIAQQQARNMQPPSMPVPPSIDPTPFSQQMVAAKICLKCKKTVSSTSKAGDKCPHCGVIWDVEEDEKGKIVGRSILGNVKAITGLVVLVIIGIGGLVKLFNR